jgi:hypothetical protein
MGDELEQVCLAQPFAPGGLLLLVVAGCIRLEMDDAEAGGGVQVLMQLKVRKV